MVTNRGQNKTAEVFPKLSVLLLRFSYIHIAYHAMKNIPQSSYHIYHLFSASVTSRYYQYVRNTDKNIN